MVAVALSRAIPGFLSPASLGDTARQAGEIGFVVLGMALVMIVGGIDLSVGSIFALCDFCALYCLNVLNWPVPAVHRRHHRLRCAARRINGVLIGYLRLRAFLTTLVTLIIFRSAYDLLLVGNSRQDRRRRCRTSRSWDFIGGGDVFGIPSVALLYVVGRDLRPHLPDAAAAGLAHHRDRRLAPLGVQFRHPGPPHHRAVLRRQRRADRRSARCSSPRGSAPSAATSASASRSRC